jgi:hypothetical protein
MLLAVSDAVVTGGAALLGALAGGAVTGWVTLQAEDKRQKFARELEKRKAAAETQRERRAEQAAARLVLREITRCDGALVVSAEEARKEVGAGPPDVMLLLPVEAWASEGKHLAGTLPGDVWRAVAAAYGGISTTSADTSSRPGTGQTRNGRSRSGRTWKRHAINSRLGSGS